MINSFLSAVLAAILIVTTTFHSAHADHIPNKATPDHDPDLIACMAAVDEASFSLFHESLITCVRQIATFCVGMDDEVLDDNAIKCLNVEARQTFGFVDVASKALPVDPEIVGVLANTYPVHYEEIFQTLQKFSATSEPTDEESAMDQAVELFSSLAKVFLLAKKTNTDLSEFIADKDDRH